MTGKTHSRGGELSAFLGFIFLDLNNLLLEDVNKFLQLAVIYIFALYGARLPDMDHHWNSAPYRDIVNWCIWKVMHPTMRSFTAKARGGSASERPFNVKHRSVVTHSDLTVAVILFATFYFSHRVDASSTEVGIISLVGVGLAFGVISHIVLDALTPEGCWSVVSVIVNRLANRRVLPPKWRLVPRSKVFRTDIDGIWEKSVNKTIWGLTFVALAWIVYDASGYEVAINLPFFQGTI